MVRIEIAAMTSILLTLVSCSLKEQPQSPQKDGSFEYSVSTDVFGTKTAMSNDGKTSSFGFITGDKIGLFIGDLHTNSKFTCSDGLSGTFSGKLKGLGITESGVQYAHIIHIAILPGPLPPLSKASFHRYNAHF